MPRIFFTLCMLLLFSSLPCSAAPAKVCTARPARQQITLTGFTRARAVLSLTAEVPGRVEQVTADVGDTIAPDGVFARIDPTLTRLELAAKQVAIRQIRRTIEYDTRQVERYRQLLHAKSSSRVHLDELLLKRDRSRLQLEQLQTEILRLQEVLDRHTIKAPPGWRIMQRQVEPGQWVAAGTVLATAGDYRDLVVPLAVTVEELTSMQKADHIPLRFPELGKDGRGMLQKISPAFDPTSRKVRVEILLQPRTLELLPLRQGGLQVEVRVAIADPMHAFLVPRAAVTERYEEHWLTREDGSGLRVIVLGPAGGSRQEHDPLLRITSPELRAGDRFLLSPVP